MEEKKIDTSELFMTATLMLNGAKDLLLTYAGEAQDARDGTNMNRVYMILSEAADKLDAYAKIANL